MTDIMRDHIASQLALLERVVEVGTDAEVGYGSDLSGVTDIPSDLTETDPSSSLNLVQRCSRRLITEPGTLFDDPDYGFNLVARLNRGAIASERALIETGIVAECMKEDGVRSVSAAVTVSGGEYAASITLEPDNPEDNPVPFAIKVVEGTNILEILA